MKILTRKNLIDILNDNFEEDEYIQIDTIEKIFDKYGGEMYYDRDALIPGWDVSKEEIKYKKENK